jgi:hypothetical protein
MYIHWRIQREDPRVGPSLFFVCENGIYITHFENGIPLLKPIRGPQASTVTLVS